ncbi:hypothetical protein KC332_g13957 [Hortaea werneckii]|nr:hypothetical protein KC358_g10706 [Hortaea werneckii]KAI6816840.1 hypothetical protein KC350_g10696 [Hortaea werneckii]KAI6907204.1 hypothetical protein KC348_g14330 [Hortaea werneckii]KAI6929361.1 hypothetical protein KC341_g10929 [Hortaea werneckii]KAI6963568.1 hypothetical protein KC321_g11139 [Hortaea werneckii]
MQKERISRSMTVRHTQPSTSNILALNCQRRFYTNYVFSPSAHASERPGIKAMEHWGADAAVLKYSRPDNKDLFRDESSLPELHFLNLHAKLEIIDIGGGVASVSCTIEVISKSGAVSFGARFILPYVIAAANGNKEHRWRAEAPPYQLTSTAFTSRFKVRKYATIIPPTDTEPKPDYDTWGSHMSTSYVESWQGNGFVGTRFDWTTIDLPGTREQVDLLNALLHQQQHTKLVTKLTPIDLRPDTDKAAANAEEDELLCTVMLMTKIGFPLNVANEIHVRIMQETNNLANPAVSAEQFYLSYFTPAKSATETFSECNSKESSATISFAVRDLKTGMATRELMGRLARSKDLLEVRCCVQTDPQRILVWTGSARL